MARTKRENFQKIIMLSVPFSCALELRFFLTSSTNSPRISTVEVVVSEYIT